MTSIEEIEPGSSVIVYDGIRLDVIREDQGKDIFGRPLIRFWCRRQDTGEEGYMSYGPGGVAQLT